mmetsp:Transcript_45310/g.120169  ORF Transcript_45310/g.120169 Transcript_45310/m.120169 type:complete len:138 (+) Transcript_45310:338-751(+)
MLAESQQYHLWARKHQGGASHLRDDKTGDAPVVEPDPLLGSSGPSQHGHWPSPSASSVSSGRQLGQWWANQDTTGVVVVGHLHEVRSGSADKATTILSPADGEKPAVACCANAPGHRSPQPSIKLGPVRRRTLVQTA